MSEAPKSKPKVDPTIIAAIIGLVGTITVALITTLMNRPAAPQISTGTAATTVTLAPGLPTSSTGAQLVDVLVTSTPASVPTVKYPHGKQFKLFYDDNSLYLLNLSEATVPINHVAFERLSNDNVPLNRFNGTRWAEFYASSLPGKCEALEILGASPYLDPPECDQGAVLSLRTPTRDDPGIFWTAQNGSHQFRVLWRAGGQDEEIARCEIEAQLCEVWLP